jgi:putative transposase
MLLNYKFEIYPTEEQKTILGQWISICRMQYNSALLDKQRIYQQEKRTYTRKEMQNQQTADKKVTPLLKEVPSQPLQEVFFRLEKAFDKFFRKEAKYPKLKKYKDYNSITFTQFGMARQSSKSKKTGKVKRQLVRRAVSLGRSGKLQISNLGLIDIQFHRNLDGKVKQVIIKRQVNRWYAIFCVERHVNQAVLSDVYKVIGIDLGINKFAVLSDGREIENPTFLRKKEKQPKRAQRKLSKKKKGSSNWKKQCGKVNRTHSKIANQRRDFLHKLSYHISNKYSVVCLEDLKVKNMVSNHHLAKSIHDAGWGMFRSFLTYKCERNGGLLVRVKPHYTSQNCSKCENTVKKSLSIRTHICPKCGLVLDRDHNAAINIEKAGLAQVNGLAS